MKRIVFSIGMGIAAALSALGNAAGAHAAPAPAAFTVCTACHKISADGANSVGPNLRGVVGRRAGSLPGYAYSAPLKASGIVWTPDKLDQWLTGPSRMIPQVKMLISVPNPADRQAVIEYLSTLK